MKPERTWRAVLALCLLSSIIPESIATFNTRVIAYVLAPVTLPFLFAGYGAPVLLIREAMVRRRLGWPGVALLAIAYAAINEGIIAATWFRVMPTGFRTILGVDWLWAVALTIFHACFSVVVPIVLANMFFPRIAGRPWLRRRGLRITGGVLALAILLGMLQRDYREPKLPILLYIALLAYCALRLPLARARLRTALATPGIWRLRISGFLGYFVFFLVMYGIPAALKNAAHHSDAIQLLDISFLVVYAGFVLFVVRRWTARVDWADQQTLALITGALAFGTLVSVVAPPALIGLQPLLTVPFLWFLILRAGALRRSAQVRTSLDIEAT